jgi:hypothetical protein
VQGCSAEAIVEQKRDLDIFVIGRQHAGATSPIGGDDELILITELAADDPLGIFSRNKVAAVRLLGKCRVRIAEAMAVARYYAERPPPPARGRRGGPRADPLRDAGKAALAELERARIEQARKKEGNRQ